MKVLKLISFWLVCLTVGCQSARPVTWTAPRYPAMLSSANIEAQFVAHIPVAADGKVGRIRFDPSPSYHELFGQVVRNALKDATFTPAKRLGKAVSSEIAMPVRFILVRVDRPLASDERETASLPKSCPSPSTALEIVVCAPEMPLRSMIVY